MELIQKTEFLIGLFIAFLGLTIAFFVLRQKVGGEILDNIGPVSKVKKQISEMSRTQKKLHLLMTIFLDFPYPLVYGTFFVGLTLRGFGEIGYWWLSIPALLVVPIDLTENIIQIMALSGNESLLREKAVINPIKFFLFYTAVFISLLSFLYIQIGH